ncbi:MAG TPA: hypothetical protein VGO03_06675 [Acidimicrobiia bacterium]|jgi:hypothetical protein
MIHNCPACGTPNDAWRPFCTKCSLRLDGARDGPPGTAGSAIVSYEPVGSSPAVAPTPAHVHARTRARATVVVIALALLTAATAGGLEVAHHTSSGSQVAATPKHWDPRIAPLAHTAEQLRGLQFKHPVAATFYSDAAFDKLDTGDSDSSDNAQAGNDVSRLAAELRALGLAPAHIDLGAETKTLVDSSVLAFYDPATKRISVRGTTLDVAHDVTIVHELTHALQDQYFDLQAVERKADATQSEAVRALIEGDARDVEDRYVNLLTKPRKAEYDAEEQRLNKSITGKVASVPDVLVLSEQEPYDLGEQFVRALRATGGVDAVNRAFRNPPTSDWYIVDPVAYMDHTKVTQVHKPQLPSGAKLLDNEGETGNFNLFLMLAERIDAHTALAASDAWRGDNTAAYSLHGTTCMAIDLAARDTTGRATMESALKQWSTHMPAHDTSIAASGTRDVDVRTCDPGAHAPALTHDATQAYALPVTRSSLLDTFLGQGAAASTAWCAADQVVYGYSVADLNDPMGAAFSKPEFLTRLKGWITACEDAS